MPRSRVACGSPKDTPGCLESFIPWGPKGDPLDHWCVPCRRRVRMTKELGGKVETVLLATDTKEVADLRNALGRALRALDDSKSKTDELIAAVRQAAADAVRALEIPAIPVPTARLGSKSGEKAAEVAICVMADWQLGKKTPSYSTEICEKRIERYAEKVLSLAAIQRAHHPVKEARVYLLGDLVEGELIFPGQAHRIDASLFRQVITDGPRILAGLLRRLASDFEKVHVVGVIGNHGALGGRERREYHPETNADAMLYETTRQVVSTEKRITWAPNVREGERLWYAVDRVGEKSFLLFHGDQVKGGALGWPWYGFGKKVAGWRNGAIRESFDYSLSGHFHQPVRMQIGPITHWGSGSTESDNSYAQEFFSSMGRPSQWLLFVHPRIGVTAEFEVYL